jgi:hypothetical protein
MTVASVPIVDFGRLVTEVDIDTVLARKLNRWMPVYLKQIEDERGLGRGLLTRPGPAQNALSDLDFPDAALPALVVRTASAQHADRNGDGDYWAEWQTRVSAIVRGRTAPETRAIASLFNGTVRRILTQQGHDSEHMVSEVRWTGSAIDEFTESGNGRWLAAGVNDFLVYSDDVLGSNDGPIDVDVPPVYPPVDPEDPPDPPYDPVAAVAAVTIVITEKEN